MRTVRILTALVFVLLLLGACTNPNSSENGEAAETQQPVVTFGIDEIREEFNAAAGQPRLVMLVDPI